MNETNAPDILLVEDNPHDAELTLRSLKKKNLANQLVVVEDGEAALDYLFCRGRFAGRDPIAVPKVVLLDLKLPKISGIDVLRALKQNEQTRAIPVVVITSSREDPDIKTAYELGVNSYVVKPVDFDAFTEAVSTVGLYWLLVNQPPI
jgi:two-component system response regulator